MLNKDLARIIQFKRYEVKNEPKELRRKREKFFDEIMNIKMGTVSGLSEMYKLDNGLVVKTDMFADQYFNQNWNTREKFPTEFDFEIDCLDKKQAEDVIIKISLQLIEKNIHFCIFNAGGSRSSHIRIYHLQNTSQDDLLKELSAFEKEEAEKLFWKKVSPMLWKYCDKGIWSEKHPLQLEFSLHWKTREPFNLVFEYIPEKKKVQQKLFSKRTNYFSKKCRSYDEVLQERMAKKKPYVIYNEEEPLTKFNGRLNK